MVRLMLGLDAAAAVEARRVDRFIQGIWSHPRLPEQHRTLLQQPLGVVQGPPGTGKTTFIQKLVTNIRGIANSPETPSRARPLVTLHVAQSNQAVNVLLRRIAGTVAMPEECVLIKVQDEDYDRETGARCLTMKPKHYDKWKALLTSDGQPGRHLHVFTTVGKLAVMPKKFQTCIDLFQDAFDLIHVDEAGQLLLLLSLTLPYFLKRGGRIVFTGDMRQLLAFAHRDWGVDSAMLQACYGLAPMLLSDQYRHVPGIGAFVSCLFYEGRVQKAAENTTRGDGQVLAGVAWGGPTDTIRPEQPYPAAVEAHFVAQLSQALQFRRGDAILTFYRTQRLLIRDTLQRQQSSPALLTVDASQGDEFESVIVSVGRTHGLGFARDRRRLCVALSRAKRRLIIVYNNRIGRCSVQPDLHSNGEVWFAGLRLLLRRLGCEHLVQTPSAEQARHLAHRLSLSVAMVDCLHGLPGEEAVRSACKAPPENFEVQDRKYWSHPARQSEDDAVLPWDLSVIFDNYERVLVGSLDRQATRPADEDDLTVEEAAARLPAALAQERLENAGPEEQESHDIKAEAAAATEAAEPMKEEDRSTEVILRAIVVKDSVLSTERFAVVVLKNFNLLFNASATAQQAPSNYMRIELLKERNGEEAARAARTHLAEMWRWSLKRYYDSMWTAAVEAQGEEAATELYHQLVQAPFTYPPAAHVPHASVASLIRTSGANFLEFLEGLHGKFAFATRGPRDKHPAQWIRDHMETYVLPFAVVWPLVYYGRAAAEKPPPVQSASGSGGKAAGPKGKGKRHSSGAGVAEQADWKRRRPDTESASSSSAQRPQQEGVKGPRYVVDIPVYLAQEGHWGTVREDRANRPGVTRRDEALLSDESNMLRITIYNPTRAARRHGQRMIGQALETLFVPMRTILEDSVEFPPLLQQSLAQWRGR